MILLLALACETKEEPVETINEPPVIEDVSVPTERLVTGDSVTLTAVISDSDGVSEVSLYYRTLESGYWDSVPMEETGEQWLGQIESVLNPGTEFYIKAVDSLGVYSLYPEEGSNGPLNFLVNAEARELPFLESFELEIDQFYLRDLDWWTPSDGRTTFAFALNSSRANSGDNSVLHPRGAEGIEVIRDWLISPPLNFTVNSGIMVGWWEFGLNVDAMDSHKLWVSTSLRLPDDGAYQEVESLESPFSGEWGRYRYLDLSEFQGEPLVYLAWSWEGSYADEWYIDDISVQSLAPDFAIVLNTTPNILVVDEAATFTVEISNVTAAEAENVSVELIFPEGGVVEEELRQEGLSISGEGNLEADFLLHFVEDLEPNRYLPVVVLITTDDDSWQLREDILIGYQSRAELEVEVFEDATTLIATIGVGDPDSPTWSESLTATTLDIGVYDFFKDITDQFEWLPAQAGDERWFITLDSSATINVTQAYLSYGQSIETAEAPEMIFADFPEAILIPPPPNYWLSSVSPSSVSPGDIAIPLTFLVYNFGRQSEGEVVGSLVSANPAVTVQNGANLLLDDNTWQTDESHSFGGPTISIDSSYTNSQPVQLELLLQDSVETIIIPIEIDVPWPHLGVLSVNILDSDDGILDPNETADLEIIIVNTGGLGASGIVTAELSVESTSTATATVVNNSPNFGFMNAGDVEDEDDFQVTVTSGSLGDSLNFLLEMTDNNRSYFDQFQLLLGERPWVRVSPFDDDIGDSLNENSPDILSIEQRVVDGIVELRIETATPIDPTTAFFEAWGESGGSGYPYYRWVLQSGVATMQGYISGVGFQPLGTLTADYEDATHVVLTFDSIDMDLGLDSFRFGIAAGWCGPPEYFCDHYPNNWGYPYVAFASSDWFTVSW